jgi:hypothetical protein
MQHFQQSPRCSARDVELALLDRDHALFSFGGGANASRGDGPRLDPAQEAPYPHPAQRGRAPLRGEPPCGLDSCMPRRCRAEGERPSCSAAVLPRCKTFGLQLHELDPVDRVDAARVRLPARIPRPAQQRRRHLDHVAVRVRQDPELLEVGDDHRPRRLLRGAKFGGHDGRSRLTGNASGSACRSLRNVPCALCTSAGLAAARARPRAALSHDRTRAVARIAAALERRSASASAISSSMRSQSSKNRGTATRSPHSHTSHDISRSASRAAARSRRP